TDLRPPDGRVTDNRPDRVMARTRDNKRGKNMSSKHDTNARRPGKEARHHIAVMRNLLMSEIDDFVAGLGQPGEPATPGQIHRELRRRVENVVDYVINPND
ncbi:TPA: hypothetical protein ACRF39_005168, partial [Escherichia coli]